MTEQPNVRRRRICIVEISDERRPDLHALLQGKIEWRTNTCIHLLCPASGRRLPLSEAALALLPGIPANDWQRPEEVALRGHVSGDVVREMISGGILVAKPAPDQSIDLDAAETQLETLGWHPLAATYHAQTRWSGVAGDEGYRDHSDAAHRERLEELVALHGLPPEAMPCRADAVAVVPLPRHSPAGSLWPVLEARRTHRAFDTSQPLPLATLSALLAGTFGTQGVAEFAPGVTAIKRTSPSGGALHPVEAYPLVVHVDGLEPGFYHYEASTHSLALLEAMSIEHARAQAAELTIAQHYFAEAHALVFLAARAPRNFWKYRKHAKAYKVLFLDAGHLSQTFYLLATEQGLGAFFTAAINDADAGDRLGLDPRSDVVIGACGVGIPAPCRDELKFQPARFDPLARR